MKISRKLLREQMSYELESFFVPFFIDHAKKCLGLTEVVVKVRIFGHLGSKLEYVIECSWVSEMELVKNTY